MSRRRIIVTATVFLAISGIIGCNGGGGPAAVDGADGADDGGVTDGGDLVDPAAVALCGAGPAAGPTSMFTGDGGCMAVIEHHPVEGCTHISCPAVLSYRTSPPSSGNHYPVWPDYHTYAEPVPWGNLVHALEHGAVDIVYNCPEGCADEVAAAQALIDALPIDPLCSGSDRRRVILAPDPTLDTRWAAAAWTWTLRADCFLPDAFAAFARDHYGQGREGTCAELGLQGALLCQ
jgi:hypothetical protein